MHTHKSNDTLGIGFCIGKKGVLILGFNSWFLQVKGHGGGGPSSIFKLRFHLSLSIGNGKWEYKIHNYETAFPTRGAREVTKEPNETTLCWNHNKF